MSTTVGMEKFQCETCCSCGVKFYMPVAIYEVARVRCEEFQFWCPNGHRQHYIRQAEGEDDDPDPGEDIPVEEGGEVVQFPVLKVVA